MKKLEISENQNPLLYKGSLDTPGNSTIVRVLLGDNVELNFNLNKRNNFAALAKLSPDEILNLSSNLEVKITFYPNGKVSCSRLDSSNEKLKQCFLFKIVENNKNYYICVAIEETSPLIYEAQLVGVICESI